jgi:uncharacterized protein YhfF
MGKNMPDYPYKISHEWNFGDDKVLADKLKYLVVSGTKTATTGLWREGKIPTPVGEYEIILDNDSKPFCIIQVTNIQVKPFIDVEWEFAQKEGEGDSDLESWRKGHRKIFRQWSDAFTDDSLVVCEEFKVVKIID